MTTREQRDAAVMSAVAIVHAWPTCMHRVGCNCHRHGGRSCAHVEPEPTPSLKALVARAHLSQ